MIQLQIERLLQVWVWITATSFFFWRNTYTCTEAFHSPRPAIQTMKITTATATTTTTTTAATNFHASQQPQYFEFRKVPKTIRNSSYSRYSRTGVYLYSNDPTKSIDNERDMEENDNEMFTSENQFNRNLEMIMAMNNEPNVSIVKKNDDRSNTASSSSSSSLYGNTFLTPAGVSAMTIISVGIVTLDTFCKQVALAAEETTATTVAAIATTTSSTTDFIFGSAFQGISQGTLNPANFQPVCPASDGLYRVLQSTTLALVGKENFVEYGPLIAGGLLRVRLELCVVESFFNEAVGPFIAQNGVSWILPIHETVETFLAGGIFALATTFILIGSTKLLTVIITYTDFLLGVPTRLIGGFTFDRAQKKPVTLDIGLGPWFQTRVIGPPNTKPGEEPETNFSVMEASLPELTILFLAGIVKGFGEVLGFTRDVLEKIDFFVGRYLVLWASFYLIVKFVHFKIFPDFP